jgi:hypothetical protein
MLVNTFRWEIALAVFALVVRPSPFCGSSCSSVESGSATACKWTPAAIGEITPAAWQQLLVGQNGMPLIPSFVLLRIENSGKTGIDSSDYGGAVRRSV